MNRGVIQHYHASEGYGFLSTDAGGLDENSLIYFHISNCDVQTPVPRVGESVLFLHNGNSKRPQVTALTRLESRVKESYSQKATTQPPPTIPSRELPRAPKATKHGKGVATRTLEAKRQLLTDSGSCFDGAAYPRFVYMDLDNIWTSLIDADHLVGRFPGATTPRELDLNLEGLTQRLTQSRPGEHGCRIGRLAAFYSTTPERVADTLRGIHYDGIHWEVRKQDAAAMQLDLSFARRQCQTISQTLVLVTGGDSSIPNGSSVRDLVELYLRDGWFVEVHAWLSTVASSFIELQQEFPGCVVVRPLNDEDVGEIVKSHRQEENGDTGGQAMMRSSNRRRHPKKTKAESKNRELTARANCNTLPHSSFAAILSNGADEVRASTHTRPDPFTPTRPLLAKNSTVLEHFATVIRELDGPDGELYIPTGICLLVKSGSAMDMNLIRNADVDTQRLLLSAALSEEMDAATVRGLQTEDPVF